MIQKARNSLSFSPNKSMEKCFFFSFFKKNFLFSLDRGGEKEIDIFFFFFENFQTLTKKRPSRSLSSFLCLLFWTIPLYSLLPSPPEFSIRLRHTRKKERRSIANRRNDFDCCGRRGCVEEESSSSSSSSSVGGQQKRERERKKKTFRRRRGRRSWRKNVGLFTRTR